MNTIIDYYLQAELSLASYGTFATGAIPVNKLTSIDVGMSPTQAAHFAATYSVVAQYSDPVTGVSATVFQQGSQKYLAIRGTQGTTDYLADYFILRGIPSQLNPQYLSLKAKVLEWMNDPNVLNGTTFTVSGHSLGGYLAAGLVADFSASISHAYLYNAPGNNSLVSQIMQALGIAATPDATKITSLRADAGISPIAGLGNDFSPPISIAIENQLLAANPPAALNHSQQILTDALAVYNLFAQLDPTLNTATSGIQTITNILKASSNIAANTLESTVSALGKLFLVNGAAGFNANEFDGNREAANDAGKRMAA